MATFARLRAAREARANASPARARGNASPARANASPGAGTPTRPAVVALEAAPTPPDATNNTLMREAVAVMEMDTRPANTAMAMDPKKEEYYQFCDKLYSQEDLKYLVTHEKAYNFMCYQMFREEKKRGGNKAPLSRNIFFDCENYKTVTSKFKKENGVVVDYPVPKNPVGTSSFTSYRAAIKQIFHDQQAKCPTLTGSWELIWLPCFKALQNHVKLRKARQKKANFEEKVDGAFAPCQMVEKYDDIEVLFWNRCVKSSPRSVCTALRHRFCLLCLTSGLLRSETTYNAEYSDFQSIILDKNDNDIHPLYVLIMQIPIGKTNKGHIRYGRGTRHRKEFSDVELEDWLDNEKWFNIKLLADLWGSDRTKKMQNDGHSKVVKEVLNELGLPTNKLLHLGRNVGSKILDLLEEWKEEKRSMGQWSPDVMDNSHSSKLPMRPMRKLAGYTRDKQPYYNIRSQVEPSTELLRATPIGQWCHDRFEEVKPVAQSARGNDHQTALQALKFFCCINQTFPQDAAAMLVEHGDDRKEMPMFKEIPVLQTQEFKECVEVMRVESSKKEDPMNASVQAVLPEVQERMSATHHEVELLRGDVQTLTTVVKDIRDDNRQQQVHQRRKDHHLASTLRALANNMQPNIDFLEAGEATDPEPPTVAAAVTQEEEEEPTTADPTIADGRNVVSVPMARKYSSLSDVWNEWFGLEEFYDAFGGVAGREKKYNSTWRKGIAPAWVFSRARRAIDGIKDFAKKNSVSNAEAVASLETMFKDCKYSLAKFVPKLMDLGHIPKKKPRGRRKSSAADDTAAATATQQAAV